MLEKTLVFIKPEHVAFAGTILAELDNYGDRLKTVYIEKTDQKTIMEHYIIHKNKPFYEWLINQITNKPIVLAIYQGENIIQTFVKIIGHSDPSKAEYGTIRNKYSIDMTDKAIFEKRAVRNVIHRSDSLSEAQREIKVWEKYLN